MKKIEVSNLIVKTFIDKHFGPDDEHIKQRLVPELAEKIVKSGLIEMKSKTITSTGCFFGEDLVENRMTAFVMTEKDFLETLRILHFIHSALPHDMKAYSDKLHSLLLGDNEMKL